METIFVQIASYRDNQLLLTLRDMIANAKNPKNLRIGIAWQHSTEDKFDNLDEFKKDSRFRIIDIDYKESQGVCWARNKIQQLYDNEKYTLQIDSHMRFAKNWDETLINMLNYLKKKGHKKPLLTAYAPSFDPDDDPAKRAQEPWRMVFDRFIPEGAIFFLPESIPNWQSLEGPVAARFYSAHMCFTLGQFSKEVQHNPEYYFHGEEISIAVRAFTHGYDLFHPHKPVIWHEYTRKGRTKHWDDDKNWSQRNEKCHLMNRKLFVMDGEVQEGHDGPYGFGKERTLRDYEKYAGILFSKRAVQKQTLDKEYPPNLYNYSSEQDWENSFSRIFKHCINLYKVSVPKDDYDFWAISFHDEKDETIYRKDADSNEINNLIRINQSSPYYEVWREFNTTAQPKSWSIWPHSKSFGWCERITGTL